MLKVRAAVLGLVAMVVLCATPSVGVAQAQGSTKRVKIEEAGISVTYPASWRVITNEIVKKEEAYDRKHPEIADLVGTTRFAAAAPQPNHRGQRIWFKVETVDIDVTVPTPEGVTGLTLEEWRDDQRRTAKLIGHQYLGASMPMVGGSVGYRSESGYRFKVRGKSYTSREGELRLDATIRGAPRGVTLKVLFNPRQRRRWQSGYRPHPEWSQNALNASGVLGQQSVMRVRLRTLGTTPARSGAGQARRAGVRLLSRWVPERGGAAVHWER